MNGIKRTVAFLICLCLSGGVLVADENGGNLLSLSDGEIVTLYRIAQNGALLDSRKAPKDQSLLKHEMLQQLNFELLRRMEGKEALGGVTRVLATATRIWSSSAMIEISRETGELKAAIGLCEDLLAFQKKCLGETHWRNRTILAERDHLARLAALDPSQQAEVRSILAEQRRVASKPQPITAGSFSDVDMAATRSMVARLESLLGTADKATLETLRLLVKIELSRSQGVDLVSRSNAVSRHEERYGKDHPLSLAQRVHEAKRITYFDPGASASKLGPILEAYRRLASLEATPEWLPVVLDQADALVSKAECHSQIGGLPLAEVSLKEAETLLRGLPNHTSFPLYAVVKNNLGTVYWQWGRDDEALQQLNEARSVKEREGKTASLAETLNQIGVVHLRIAKKDSAALAKAESAFSEARDIWVAAVGERGQEYGTMLVNLGLVAERRKQTAKAVEFYGEGIAVLEKSSPNTAFIGDAYLRLGEVSVAAGDLAKAAAQFSMAADKYRRSVGEISLGFLESVERLFDLSCQVKDAKGIIRHGTQWMWCAKQFMFRVLPGMTDDEQRGFLASEYYPTFHKLLSSKLLFESGSKEADGLAFATAEWAINGKGLGSEALSISLETFSRGLDSAQPGIFAELRDARVRKARAVSRGRSSEAAVIEERERELVRSLAGRSQDDGVFRYIPLSNLRMGLPPDAALLEFVRIPLENDRSLYLGWAIHFDVVAGRMRVVSLEYNSIDLGREVSALRESIGNAADAIAAEGESAAEQRLERQVASLSRSLVHEFERNIPDEKTRWVVSPDGPLWLLPLEMLRLASGRYVIEGRQISYVLSGRDLVNKQWRSALSAKAPMIIGDPDYDAVVDKSGAGNQVSGLAGKRSSDREKDRFPANWTRSRSFEREIEWAVPLISRFAGQPTIRTGGAASEASLFSAESPRILVAVTHGFYRLPNAEESVADDPFQRCGIVLAGANKIRTDAPVSDDGILTGAEVLGLDLRSTECVVLSACETGVGDPRMGDGVSSLRHAFQLAGAHSVLSSLWKVPDDSTERLMSYFWQGRAEGLNVSDALRSAQLKVIAERRAADASNSAHPYFWAAFVSTGDVLFTSKPGKVAKVADVLAAMQIGPGATTEEIAKKASDYLAKSGKDFNAHLIRAIARQDSGDHSGAVDDFNCAIQMNPSMAELWFGRGSSFWELGMFEYAFKDFEAATRLEPSDAQKWKRFGDVARQTGRKAEGYRYWQKALQLDPMMDLARFLLARAYLEDNTELSSARQSIDLLLKSDAGNPRYLLLRGWLHLRQGDPTGAYPYFRDSIKAFKGSTLEEAISWEAFDLAGDCFAALDNPSKAVIAWKEAHSRLLGRNAVLYGEPKAIAEARIQRKIALVEGRPGGGNPDIAPPAKTPDNTDAAGRGETPSQALEVPGAGRQPIANQSSLSPMNPTTSDAPPAAATASMGTSGNGYPRPLRDAVRNLGRAVIGRGGQLLRGRR